MTVKVEVFSDVICPWCFVGKRRLDRAMSQVGQEFDVLVTWRAFELNPDMPREGMNRKDYRSTKFGSWERSQALDAQLSALGARNEIDFAFDRIERTPNTFDAHRVIWLALRHGVQDVLVEALFHHYFVLGDDIGAPGTLATVAGAHGLDAIDIDGFLSSDEGVNEVRMELARAWQMGVQGVPHFLINGSIPISGAQEAETLMQAIQVAAGRDAAPLALHRRRWARQQKSEPH